MASRRPDHKLAQALDLARREAGLKTAELAQALAFHPRTVRRYLNGERRPERETVVCWEQICKVAPGTLTALYDRDPSSASSAPPPPSKARFPRRSAVVATVVVVISGAAFVLLRGSNEASPAEPAPQHLTGVAYHRFTASFVGDVWIRITPAREHAGESHRVVLTWGQLVQAIDLRHLDRSRTLFTGKRNPDRVSMQVSVSPAATITFGERDVPAGAQDINRGWKTTG